ncbi:NAD(P)/FAD-dependent oxidoreductase [Paenibacillus agricola]|uniref:NAD(P)/FAD-dependent oxidoreductase n=1 Tax=Paenibacillus agricola TaxID=2716264 RepID=A0ABX0JAJ4_9BACL|nr:NAD(P)/FAD-dependent oxidoreductase [Paenibacillus agricola]NHN31798.1 NAD(P)/FAD-dependent oxidoreductase [Paenibacillus agricola]
MTNLIQGIANVDVAVLGAGVAGSSLAKALADGGWDTVLIDQHQFPRHKVCGEFLSPESQSTLGKLGLLGAVESLHPQMISGVRVIFSDGGTIEIPLPGDAYGVSRYVLDSAFHNVALKSGVQLQTATTVTSVYPKDGGYTIEAKYGGEQKLIRAQAVIAAWGANRRAGLPGYRSINSVRNTYIGVKSHFQGIAMEPVIELYVFPGGYLGISPIEDGVVNVAALMTRRASHDHKQNGDKTVLGMIGAAASRNPKLYQKLSHAIPVHGTQAAVAPVDLDRKPVAWDMVPLVGDAALMIPPLCGDGMSIALRSAACCAAYAHSYLRGEISQARWQHEYTESIQREFYSPLRWGRFLHRLVGMPLLPRLLPGIAQLAPWLASAMVQATRLKP